MTEQGNKEREREDYKRRSDQRERRSDGLEEELEEGWHRRREIESELGELGWRMRGSPA